MFTEVLENGTYRHTCPRCGRVVVSGAPRHRCVCRMPQGAEGKPFPSLAARAASWAAAEARWWAAGRPVRSAARVAEIFDICRECEYFQRGPTEREGWCQLCGCRLRRAGGLLNKIEMATEGCPAQPPRWEPEVNRPSERAEKGETMIDER